MRKFLVLLIAVIISSNSFSQDVGLAISSQPPSIAVNQVGKVILQLMNLEVQPIAVPSDKLRPFVSFPNNVRVDSAHLPEGWSIIANDGQTIRFGNTTDGPTFLPDATPRVIEIFITGVSIGPAQLIQANLAYNGAYGANGYPDDVDNNDPTTTIQTTAALPVFYAQELKGVKAGNVVELSWKTGVETNNKGFAVQKSTDNGATYTSVAFVEGKGSNSSYSYTDNSPVSGVNQYRLEQLDLDGKKSLSNVVSVNFDGVSGLSVYPNPATSQITVKSQGLVQIYDLSGKLVLTQQAVNGAAVINISKLAKGTYVVKSGSANAKFIKL